MSEWRSKVGPWARATMPDGQTLDVLVTSRERSSDGQWWFHCEAILPVRQEVNGRSEAKAYPIPFIVHAGAITPIPGEDYGAVPTEGEVAGRQWLLARIRMQLLGGPEWRLHRRDCWQATGEQKRITTAEAVEALHGEPDAPPVEICDVCRPDRALAG